MARPRIVYEQFPSAEVRNRIELGVDLHNIAVTQRADFHAVGFLLHGDDDEIQGGLLGELWGGWLHISYLWVAEPLRHRGWATRLVRAAERFARRRGAHDANLETFSFQARPLYERLGYEVFASLEDFPPGHTKYYLRKRLARRR